MARSWKSAVGPGDKLIVLHKGQEYLVTVTRVEAPSGIVAAYVSGSGPVNGKRINYWSWLRKV